MFGYTSDELLARKAQLGDRDAFYALYDRYLKRVYNRVKSKVPPQDVEDVTQDVFIALVRSLDSYEQRSKFNTWLYTIVNRQIADFYRRRNRSIPNQSLDDGEDGMRDIPDDTDIQANDQRIILQVALANVPDHYQEIVLQRFADGLSFAEIAEQRGQSLEAVKSLYRRAIQAIRDNMDEVDS